MISSVTLSRAQSDFQISRIVNNFPTIKLYVRALCNKEVKLDITSNNVQVKENGIPVSIASFSCPNVPVPCCISATLVFDRSGSMAGKKLTDMQSAGIAFIQGLDGFCDQASIVSFDTRVTLDVQMTTNKSLLIQAIDNFQTGGGTAIWDGAYTGIQELVNHSSSGCKTVVLLTDGEDNASTHTINDVINYAKSNGVSVMVVGLQVGGSYESDLSRLAKDTGGQYFKAISSDDLKAIFVGIQQNLSNPLPECELTYKSSCPDGMTRKVEAELDYCGSRIIRTALYKAPLDTNRSFASALVKMGQATVGATEETLVPFTIESVVSEAFQASAVTIFFDDQCMQFVELITKGYLLQDIPITWKKIPGGIMLQIPAAFRISMTGVLAYLKFRASDPNFDKSCPISIKAWDFSGGGCVRVYSLDGSLNIIARQPHVECRIDMPSEMHWEASKKDYDQNPLPVSVILRNIGNRDAMNPKTTIIINTKDFSLYNPKAQTQDALPKIISRDVGSSAASWQITAERRQHGDTLTVCATTTFDNHPAVYCCAKVYVPPAPAILACNATAPVIKADKTTNTYYPMPFDVSVEIENRGGMTSDSVYATIIAPPEFEFVGTDRFAQTKRAFPAILNPNGKTDVRWTLSHPVSIDAQTYSIVVCTFAKNADTSCCTIEVNIPALSVPVLNCAVILPDSIGYDDSLDIYTPNPFYVMASVVNSGVLDADSVSATIDLPPELELDPPNQPIKKYFTPMKVVQWNKSLPPNELLWSVRAKEQLTVRCVKVGMLISGYDEVGKRYHESSCANLLCIPPHYITPITCFISAPDTLQKDPTETAYIPNPMNVWCTIINTGKRRLDSVKATLTLPKNVGLSFDANDYPTKLAGQFIDPGNSLQVGWTVKTNEKAIIRTPVLQVQTHVKNITVGDSYCDWKIFIPSLKVALSCSASAPDTIHYDKANADYSPDPFNVKLDLLNNSGVDLHDVTCSIQLPPELKIILPDSIRKTISNIPVAQSVSTRWNIGLAQNLLIPKTVTIIFKYTQNGIDEYECPVSMYIDAAQRPILECSIIAPDSIKIINNIPVPNIFDLSVKIFNRGNDAAHNVHAYLLNANKFDILSPADVSVASTFLASDSSTINFRLQSKPQTQSSADSIQILLTAAETSPSRCQKTFWIEGIDQPQFTFTCGSIKDSLLYDPQVFDYTPNPLPVAIKITNTSSFDAPECKLIYVGSKGFSLDQQQSIINIGTLASGQSYSTTWSIRALRHAADSYDTVLIQFQSKGVRTNQIIISECRLPLYVSAAKDQVYKVDCNSPAALIFQDSAYAPSPFTFHCTVLNQGRFSGQNVKATISLPPGLSLAPGENQLKDLYDISASGTESMNWLIIPDKQITANRLDICVDVIDESKESGHCCSSIDIIKQNPSPIRLICSAPDTIFIENGTGNYINNPFLAALQIFNSSGIPLDSVIAQINPLSNDLSVLDPEGNTKLAALQLSSSGTVKVNWNISTMPRNGNGLVRIHFIASAKGAAQADCEVPVFIYSATTNNLSVSCATQPADTLHYIMNKGDFEQNPFTFTAAILNLGPLISKELRASIILPPAVSLADSEISEKYPIQKNLFAGDTAHLSWRLTAHRQYAGAVRDIQLRVNSSNGADQQCTASLFIQGAPLSADVSIPQNIFGKFDEDVEAPLILGQSSGKDIRAYRFRLQYDPEVIAFKDIQTVGTATEHEWAGTQMKLISDSVIEISDYTTGSPVLDDTKELVRLVFHGVYKDAATTTSIGISPMHFITSVFNSGDVLANNSDGRIYITGNCIAPLSASSTFNLRQNNPNPFGTATLSGNPTTIISFSIPEETRVRITVLDPLGRSAGQVIDEVRSAGQHNVLFNASQLSSGIYFCKMETTKFVKVIKMIYQR